MCGLEVIYDEAKNLIKFKWYKFDFL
jgi:hypothetical protein